MEQEHRDQSHISESQPPSPDEKNCKYCRTPIRLHALVCSHCRYHQRWWPNYFQQFGFLVSIAVLGISIWQFRVALEQRTKADEALQRASQVEELTRQTQLLVDFNLLITKANTDDRKAFDDLWTMSHTPRHPFQELARRATETFVWDNSTLPRDPALVGKLEALDYSELLQFYRNSPRAHGPSVLIAANRSTRLTEEEKADFLPSWLMRMGAFAWLRGPVRI